MRMTWTDEMNCKIGAYTMIQKKIVIITKLILCENHASKEVIQVDCFKVEWYIE